MTEAVRLWIVRFSANEARLDSKSPVNKGELPDWWFPLLLVLLLLLLLLLRLDDETWPVTETGCKTPPNASKLLPAKKLHVIETH